MKLLVFLRSIPRKTHEEVTQILHWIVFLSTGFKRKTSKSAQRLRCPVYRHMFSDLNLPLKVMSFTNELPQYEVTNFMPLRRFGVKPFNYKKKFDYRKYFPSKRNVEKSPKRDFLKDNCKFFRRCIFKSPRSFETDQFPGLGVRKFMGSRKVCHSKLYSPKKRRQYSNSVYVPFNYRNFRFGPRKLLKKKHKRFSNFKRQCVSNLNLENENNESVVRNVSANDKVETNAGVSFVGEKLPRDFPKPHQLTPILREDSLTSLHNLYPDEPETNLLSPNAEEASVSRIRNTDVFQIGDDSKSSFKESLAEDISKLKHMISDVENTLKGRKQDSLASLEEEPPAKKKPTKTTTVKPSTNATAENFLLKEKIDKLAIPILTQISEDLTKNNTNVTLSEYHTTANVTMHNGTDKNVTGKNERCNPDGTWSSQNMGMDLTFTVQKNMVMKIAVKFKKESPVDDKWSLQGLVLSKRGGPFIIAGLYPQKKKVASFLGQCKISKDEDFIFGIWTLFSFSRKYTDLWKSVETKLDVLTRKTSVEKKKKKKHKKKDKE